jgi:FkbM family methyltransferase
MRKVKSGRAYLLIFVIFMGIGFLFIKYKSNNLLLENRTAEAVKEQCFSFSQLSKLYNSFGDDFSKKLFLAKLDESLNNNMFHMLRIMSSPEFKENTSELSSGANDEYVSNIIDYIREMEKLGSKCILFGNYEKGFFQNFLSYIDQLEDLGVEFSTIVIEDRQNSHALKQIKRILPYVSIITRSDFLNNYKDENIILFSSSKWAEHKNWLIENGINSNKMFVLFDFYYPQYFSKDIMVPKQHEIFIDGGAYNMATSIDFINWCNGEYDYIYAFEPNLNSYKNCKDIIQNNDVFMKENQITIYNKGLFDKTTQLKFNSLPVVPSGAFVSSDGKETIDTVSIDEVLDGKPVTFIKLDIEGSELAALAGAKDTITKWKPRMAVCIYHKPSDVIDISLFILSLVPDYKLYIRHYSTYKWETVLYCVCE